MEDPNWLNLEQDDLANDSSFPATFAEYFSKEIGESIKLIFNQIGNTWINIGFSMDQCEQKIASLRTNILNVVNKAAEDEKAELNNQLNLRESKLFEINKILQALSLEEFKIDSSRSLLMQNKILHFKFNELIEVKRERMEQLEQITTKIKKTSFQLGLSYEEPIFATNIPSELELLNLKSVWNNQNEKLEQRKKRFRSLKATVLQHINELEYQPQNSEEQMLLDSSGEIIYSQENLQLMANFHKKSIMLYNHASLEIDSLNRKMHQLYDRLDTDEQTRRIFQNSLVGTFAHKKKLLTVEIEKYEQLKKSCMEKIIKNIRQDIEKLYCDCKVHVFMNDHILESQDYTEDLLLLHEKEFEKLKLFKQHYGAILEKLDEWECLIEKLLDLEKKSMDPNRFNNRGGALLTNERDRRLLNKKLPRLEKEIRNHITMIESKEHFLFSTYGLDIDEFFDSNWSKFHNSKNDVKKTGIKRPGADSSTKSSSQQFSGKKRYPLSPRNIQTKKACSNPMTSRQLFTPNIDYQTEKEFQKHLIRANSNLQSTILCDDTDKHCSQTRLASPHSEGLKKNRRISKSYDDLFKMASGNAPFGVTKRKKPFLP